MALPQTVFVGERYGRLVVVGWRKDKQGWECICDCGNTTYQNTFHLKVGNVLSCGCYRKECDVLDGWSQTPTWSSFRSMHQRCDGEDKRGDYLRKGIVVCEKWELSPTGFFNFLDDMGERPEGRTLERKDTNGNYSPENCKWDTPSNQAFNRELFKNNKSGVTGVSFDKYKGKWVATLHKEGETVLRETFFDFDEAVLARKEAEQEYYKEKIEETRLATGGGI